MRRAQDLSVNTNWNVGHSDGTPNFEAGLPYQLPTPSGEGPSPWKGGLPNVAVTMQKGGYATAHYGKWRKSRQPLVVRTPAAIYSAHCAADSGWPLFSKGSQAADGFAAVASNSPGRLVRFAPTPSELHTARTTQGAHKGRGLKSVSSEPTKLEATRRILSNQR